MGLKVAELNAHYKPQSPLAALQIQRIARCAVKLETLYAVERAKSDLALMQAAITDDQVMEHFAHFPAGARHLALQSLQQIKPKPPFDLTDRLLDQICLEIDAFIGVLRSESDLRKFFPKLGRFLQSCEIKGFEGPFSLDHHIWLVAKFLRDHNNALGLSAHSASTPSKMPPFEELLLKVWSDESDLNLIGKGIRPQSSGQSFDAAVKSDLNVWKQLKKPRLQAKEIVAQFAQVKTLVVTATTMPNDDADRFMRYQTALEKQLSRYIGELLQLLSLNPAQSAKQ